MALTIYTFNNFKKRINSTKRPTLSDGTKLENVLLKAPTSMENPTFQITPVDMDVNYVVWGDHYYFVNDKTLGNKDIMEVHCRMDPLATYKTDILATSAFVEYSTSDFNSDILDGRISNTGIVSQRHSSSTALTNIFTSTGWYIVSIVGEDGIAKRFCMTASELKSLITSINSITDDPLLDAAVKKYSSLLNCIVGVKWIPFEVFTSSAKQVVKIGGYNTGLTAYVSDDPVWAKSFSTDININWINSDRCRKDRESIEIYLPGYGVSKLDASKLSGKTSIEVGGYFDLDGGVMYYVEYPGNERHYFNTNLGVNIPITQYTQSPVGSLLGMWSNGMIEEQGQINAQAPWLSSFNSFMSNITGRLSTIGSTASSVGGYSGGSGAWAAADYDTIYLVNYSYGYSEAQADMASRYGRPLMAVKSLSALTGYCKCNGASVNISGTDGDKQDVNAFVNSGFYIE